ncbi:MAG TPA: ROK family protein [Gaiellaceae bacterium]|nr:ROK family protein [Gaiellaceae bacterium]
MGAQRVIGVDVGGTKTLAGVVGRDGEVGRTAERATPNESQDELLAALDEIVEELRAGEQIEALGFGLPSTIDQKAGTAVSSVHVPLTGVAFRSRMSDRYELPVGMDNDGNAAAIAEWQLGAGRGTRHMIMLTLGTGIGGGLILDGKPYRGAIGAGAELGHIVLQYGGPPCGPGCDGHGHFETLVSGSAADRAAQELFGPSSNARELVERARDGDEAAAAALAEVGHKLGTGIATLINIFEPEMIVLGGGFANAGDLVFDAAREAVAQEALPPGRDLVRIVPAQLGPRAGMVGAALIAFEQLDRE